MPCFSVTDSDVSLLVPYLPILVSPIVTSAESSPACLATKPNLVVKNVLQERELYDLSRVQRIKSETDFVTFGSCTLILRRGRSLAALLACLLGSLPTRSHNELPALEMSHIVRLIICIRTQPSPSYLSISFRTFGLVLRAYGISL